MAKKHITKKIVTCNSESAVYALGLVGALVYHVATATSFVGLLWGIVKSILWPAFLVFELFKFFA